MLCGPVALQALAGLTSSWRALREPGSPSRVRADRSWTWSNPTVLLDREGIDRIDIDQLEGCYSEGLDASLTRSLKSTGELHAIRGKTNTEKFKPLNRGKNPWNNPKLVEPVDAVVQRKISFKSPVLLTLKISFKN